MAAGQTWKTERSQTSSETCWAQMSFSIFKALEGEGKPHRGAYFRVRDTTEETPQGVPAAKTMDTLSTLSKTFIFVKEYTYSDLFQEASRPIFLPSSGIQL